MYLSRIEMTGFKSFADKTIIEFDKGMTAVVGPNGSGKSNLSEAIRWVLGEQSAKSLRGNKMEDVIFNGTQARKAVNLAKVTLVLNNEDRYLDYDFNEIAITRSYNRNGESSYFINKEAVRLKDIVDLLLDSGLGKNSFAMISQGKVEAIFLNKPEERRAIFEEAAGVQKYQFRKQEAERKLIKSSDHLSRVKDIIHELEQQLKPLAEQREVALIYQEKKALLKQLEISLYVYQICTYQLEWEQSKEDYQAVCQQLVEFEAKITALEAAIVKDQQALDNLTLEIDHLADRTQVKSTELERYKSKHQILQQQLVYQQSSETERTEQYQRHQAEYAHKTEQCNQLKITLSSQQTELTDLHQQLSQVQAKRDALARHQTSDTEAIRSRLITAYQAEATANNEIRQASLNQERYQRQMTEWQAKYHETDQHLTAFTAEFKLTEAAYRQLQTKPNELEAQLANYQDQRQTLGSERQQLEQAIFHQERQNHMKEARLQSLQQLQEDYAGYYGGVKAVMKHKQLTGIKGPVADLITVPATLQLAIDTALAGALQYIVVADDASARHAIEYLKTAQAGRATFLPISNIKGRYLSDSLLQLAKQAPGFIGIASELISYDATYQAIMTSLLGTTVVCEHLKQAQALAKASQQKLRIVTLAGDILMPGGALTGGHHKQATSTMLNRQQEIKTLQDEIRQGHAQQVALDDKRKANQSALDAIQKQMGQVKETLAEQHEHYQATQQAYLNGQQTLKQLQNQVYIQQDEVNRLQASLEQVGQIFTQASVDLTQAQEQIQQLNLELEGANLSGAERQTQLTQLDQQLADFNTQYAVKKLELKQAEQELAQLDQQLVDLREMIGQYEQAQSDNQMSLKQLDEEITEVAQLVIQAETNLQQAQTQFTQLKTQRQTLQQDQRSAESLLQDLRQDYQATYKQEAKLQANCEKYESFIDTHLTYLNEEYQLSFEAAQQQAIDLSRQHQQVNQEVKQLKRDMERLGPINLAAIEDFESLNLRYQNLKAQETDLLTAMDQLKTTMAEMEVEVTKRFSHTFNLINQQFQLTFRKLFGGGEAALTLTNPDDLLTTGVDIIAQPPGKRKQHLALLSGGERAFTAIALLFAILETKPVPFCVLDEVEAALDDANVYRYGQYLQTFTQQTQFIVITHRKGTMEHADVLYGVTMQQSGISKLASVRLNDAQDAV